MQLPSVPRVKLQALAADLSREGHSVLQLNTMDPAVFDFHAPDPILRDVAASLPSAQGYGPHQGIFAARRSIALHYETVPGFPRIDHSDVWLGNGASELILMAMQAMIVSASDEVLVPCPSEAIWPSAVLLAGAKPIRYECEEGDNWNIDVDAVAKKMSDQTRAIVVSNPNNPTGRIYPEETLSALSELCARRGVVMVADETLGRVLFPPTSYVPMGVFATDTLCLTFDSLSFGYRAPGYRAGWMVISGSAQVAPHFIPSFTVLSELRRSANTLGQNAIQVALGGRQTIAELTAPGGRLWEQREAAMRSLSLVDGIRCYRPDGGFSVAVGVDEKLLPFGYGGIGLANDLLQQQHVLVDPGECFGFDDGCYFRITFLARERIFDSGVRRIGNYLRGVRR